MKIGDEVITLVKKADIPKDSFGVVEKMEGEKVWVAIYIPADADTPYDIVRYSPEDLRIQ